RGRADAQASDAGVRGGHALPRLPALLERAADDPVEGAGAARGEGPELPRAKRLRARDRGRAPAGVVDRRRRHAGAPPLVRPLGPAEARPEQRPRPAEVHVPEPEQRLSALDAVAGALLPLPPRFQPRLRARRGPDRAGRVGPARPAAVDA